MGAGKKVSLNFWVPWVEQVRAEDWMQIVGLEDLEGFETSGLEATIGSSHVGQAENLGR